MKAGIIAALWLSFAVSPASAAPAELRAGGTGGATELLRQLAVEFGKETGDRTDVIASLGTAGSLRALVDGHLDLAVAGRPLKADEQAKGLKVALVVRTPFVLATSHKAPGGLASADVVRAFADPNLAWPDGTPIRVILRPRSESDAALMAEMFPGLADAIAKARQRPEVPVAATDQDNADLAERSPGTLIGMTLVQLLLEKRDLRIIPIDGRDPTKASFADGTYSYSKLFYFVTREQPGEVTAAFLRFLDSAKARDLMAGAFVFPARAP
jgi:phosphate transport system substrate-binding protein